MKEMKKYHLAHHYKNFELGFGVTSKPPVSPPQRESRRLTFFLLGKIWDIVFNTVLRV